MQNIVLLGRVAALGVIEGVTAERLERAIAASVPPKLLERNLAVYRRALGA
jgi:Pyruvate/2-oxoacid:ferredoxin oxidoreductase gamma subunit